MNHEEEILGAFFSFVVAIIFWRILIIPGGFFIAVTIGIVCFLIYRYITKEKESYYFPNIRFKKYFVCFLVLSILSVILISKVNQAIEFMAWDKLPILSILRLFLGSPLAVFFPGFMVLSLIDRRKLFTGLEKVFFSILISLLILPFLGILTFAFGWNIQNNGSFVIILLNLVLLVAYLLKNENYVVRKKTKVDLNGTLILLSLLLLISSIYIFSKYSLNLTWDYGDYIRYFGGALAFTKNSLPLSVIGPGLEYPFWLSIFLAQNFSLSGVPAANAFQFMLILLSFLPIISFYIMISKFFKESNNYKIAAIATTFGFFGAGFGWLYSTNLFGNTQTIQGLFNLFTNSASADSGYLALPISPLYTVFTYYVALATIFALIWLVYSKRALSIGNLRYIFVSIAVALGYLLYISLTAFFILIFLVSFIIFKRENLAIYRKYAVSIIFGLILVILADLIMNGSYYTYGDALTLSGFSLFDGVLSVAIIAFFLSFIKIKIPSFNDIISKTSRRMNSFKVLISILVVYLYCICFLIVDKVLEDYGHLPNSVHDVPWYAWPIRLGISGLVALPVIIYLLYRGKSVKEYTFFIFLVPISFVIGRILHVYPFYFEDRLTFFVLIPTMILASYGMLKLNEKLKKRLRPIGKNIAVGIILSAILILGFLPPLLVEEAIDNGYWVTGQNLGQNISADELDAFNFLRLNTPSNSSVLTLSTRSNYLLPYAGLSDMQTRIDSDPSIMTNPVFAETALYSLMEDQVKYIYLSTEDALALDHSISFSGFVKDYLLKYLPIVFQNKEVTIYELPQFSSSASSNTALVTPASVLKIGYFLDLFNGSYNSDCRFCSVVTTGNIITVKADKSNNTHDFEIPFHLDPNEYPYVTIRWKTDGHTLNFYLRTSNTVHRIAIGGSTTWQTTVINLHDFFDLSINETVGIDSNERVFSMLFRIFESSVEYSIDSIQFAGFSNDPSSKESSVLGTLAIALSQNEYSTVQENDPSKFNYSTLILPDDLSISDETGKQNFQNYMNWVNLGGHLIFLESSDNKAFANALSINRVNTVSSNAIQSQTGHLNLPSIISVPVVMSSNRNVRVIANYTLNNAPISPYALSLAFGSGKITCLVVSPYFSLIKENSTEGINRIYFSNVGSLLNVVDLGLKKNIANWKERFPEFEFVRSPLNFSGKITVDSDFVQLPNLVAYSIKVIANNNLTKAINLSNATIEYLEYVNPIKFRIDASELDLQASSGTGSYLNVELAGDFNLTLEIPQTSTAKITIQNSTTALNEELQDSIVKFDFKNVNSISLSLKNPIITAEGKAYFSEARIYRNQYRMPLFYDDGSKPFEVIGTVSFNIVCSDADINFVSNSAFNGRVFYPSTEQEYQSQLTEFNIPWLEILVSPLQEILIASFVVILIGYFVFRRRKCLDAGP
jgi:hypothetical protein